MRHPVRHRREEAQVRHRQDLDQARAECERAREQASVRLSSAASAAAQQFAVANVQRQDTPNDPGYDLAEPDDPDSTLNGGAVTPSTNLYDEQFGFFGFPSQRTRSSALYATGPNAGKPQISGFNAAGAWKLERGRPDVAIAILDTGIKWDKESLRLQIHLNKGELPVPKADRATP